MEYDIGELVDGKKLEMTFDGINIKKKCTLVLNNRSEVKINPGIKRRWIIMPEDELMNNCLLEYIDSYCYFINGDGRKFTISSLKEKCTVIKDKINVTDGKGVIYDESYVIIDGTKHGLKGIEASIEILEERKKELERILEKHNSLSESYGWNK